MPYDKGGAAYNCSLIGMENSSRILPFKRTRLPSFVSQLFSMLQIFLKSFLELRSDTCVVDDKIEFLHRWRGNGNKGSCSLGCPDAIHNHRRVSKAAQVAGNSIAFIDSSPKCAPLWVGEYASGLRNPKAKMTID